MALFSASPTWKVVFILVVSAVATAHGSKFGSRIRAGSPNLYGSDLLALESADDSVTSDAGGEKDSTAEETKDFAVFRDNEKLVKPPSSYKLSVQNVTNEKYNYLQWFAEPKSPMQHHAEQGTSRRKVFQDLSAQSTSYSEGYTRGHIDYRHHHDEPHPVKDHSHVDHHHHYDHYDVRHSSPENAGHYEPEKYSHDVKPRGKKIRKKCHKERKSGGLAGKSDGIVHSMSKQTGPAISSYSINTPLTSDERFSMEKFKSLSPMGFSAEHLHGIPKVPAYGEKIVDNGNHFHLHSHHYHYDAHGNKVSQNSGSYKSLIQGLQKLLPLALPAISGVAKMSQLRALSGAGGSGIPPVTQSGKPMVNPNTADVKLAQEGPKMGYHYTGPHNSYGRKTYHRMKNGGSPNTNFPESDGGPGPYGYENEGTGYGHGHDGPSSGHGHDGPSSGYGHDGPNSGHGPYGHDGPNTGSGYGHDVPNTGSGYGHDGPNPGPEPYGYGNDSPTSHASGSGINIGAEMYKRGIGPYSTDEFRDSSGANYPNEVNLDVDKFHSDHFNGHSEKPSYTDGYGSDSASPEHHDHGPSGYNPGYDDEKANLDYDDKAPYVPYDQILANRKKNAVFVGHKKPDGSEGPYHYEDRGHGDIPKHDDPSEFKGPVLTHTSTVFPDHGIEELMYDPEKHPQYKDLKPEPDPLSIPKNARIIEHHIRLDPRAYTMFSQMPLDYSGPALPSQVFGQHIPLYKLMHDPLKAHPSVVVGRIPPHQVNHMLQAYQSRSLYHRWW